MAHYVKRGDRWAACREHGDQPALVCPTLLPPDSRGRQRRAHPTIWVTGRNDPTACPTCGEQLQALKLRRQEWETFDTKREARAWVEGHNVARGTGAAMAPSKEEATDYLRRWHGDRQDDLEASSWTWERRVLDTYVLYPGSPLTGVRLQEVRRQHVQAIDAHLKARGLSPSTRRSARGILRNALADAVDDGTLSANPVTPQRHKRSRKQKDSTPPREVPFATHDELAAFWPKVAADRDLPLWWLLAYTGMRRGEGMALRWSDVELDRPADEGGPVLHVRRNLTTADHQPVMTTPKTEHGRRSIVVDAESVRVLREWRKVQAADQLAAGAAWADTEGLIFTDKTGQARHPELAGRRFKRQAERHGLPIVGMHGLRHSHCSQLISAGVPPMVVSRRLGHHAVSFTLDRYGHLMPGDEAAAVEAVTRLQAG